MRKFWWVAGILTAAAALSISPAEADYKFDDLLLPSGVGEQWMVVTDGGQTLGARAGGDVDTTDAEPLEASGDIVSGRNAVVLMNGNPDPAIGDNENRDIYAMFFVHRGGSGTLTVDFHAPSISEATTPDVLEGSYPDYQVKKTDKGTVNDTAKRYELAFVKNSNINKATGNFGSVHGQFIFHQNPRYEPSQTAIVPFVIASVC
ncbi:MAG: hypothetical protein K6E38_06045, partial [Fretibacterium sp.]|nr:hypothetical protein [Fretibacterium sp.]